MTIEARAATATAGGSRRRWGGALALLGVITSLCSAPAFAQPHKGSLGLTVDGGFEALTAVGFSGFSDRGFRVPTEVGGTLGLFDRNELTLSGRLAFPVGPLTGLALSFYGGLRNSIEFERWKTFFDVQLAIHAVPFFSAGLRAGFGVMYELLPIIGVYAKIALQLGGGAALRLSGDVSAGLQFRTYIF